MFYSRVISLIRRCIALLPPRLRLRVTTRFDIAIRAVEPENVYIPELAAHAGHKAAVDVGANNGVTTSILAGSFETVYAFEANPILSQELILSSPPGAQVWSMALSSQEGEAVLIIPIAEGVMLAGWGSIQAPLLEQFDQSQQFRVPTRTLDSFDFQDVGLIKIDVEGHELAVLTGSRQTLERCHPWLIVEALGEQQDLVREFLIPLGYRESSLQVLTGRLGSLHNLVFLPMSELAAASP